MTVGNAGKRRVFDHLGWCGAVSSREAQIRIGDQVWGGRGGARGGGRACGGVGAGGRDGERWTARRDVVTSFGRLVPALRAVTAPAGAQGGWMDAARQLLRRPAAGGSGDPPPGGRKETRRCASTLSTSPSPRSSPWCRWSTGSSATIASWRSS